MNQNPRLVKLFEELFWAGTADEVDLVIKRYSELRNPKSWRPLDNNDGNYSIVENQQSNPIASLVEKVVNGMDARLTRKCLEAKIEPSSDKAPKSMAEAVSTFIPDSQHWNDNKVLRNEAENIQILAHGPKGNTSLVIYDNGEGQHPADFDKTFLSLAKGNKNKILFVQGKYNMGGSGAIVFCQKGYQLIASKKFDGKGDFGFTLIRVHPLTEEERSSQKNTWYEYFTFGGQIPSFPITELDLGLHKRKFRTGSIVKLYSYQLPGVSDISRDLTLSMNEFLFKPVLPYLLVESKERYPHQQRLDRVAFGLYYKLENEESKYIEFRFSADISKKPWVKMPVKMYVFKTRVDDKTVKETKETIQKEFFKNGMSVLFTMNGQVHAYYTYEFISRSLQFGLLKQHLLIHVDCSDLPIEIRNELFMASRDRLKEGIRGKELRADLTSELGGKDSRLAKIEKERKSKIALDGEDSRKMIQQYAKNLNPNSELFKLLKNSYKIEAPKKSPEKGPKPKPKTETEKVPFKPERYPTFLRAELSEAGGKKMARIPKGGKASIRFSTDVEDGYFDRADDPGEMKIGLTRFRQSNGSGGDKAGTQTEVTDFFAVTKMSPDEGTIRVIMTPNTTLEVGDEFEISAILSKGSEFLEEVFFIQIKEPEQAKEKAPQEDEGEDVNGFPEFIYVFKEEKEGKLSWDQFSEATGETMDEAMVLSPFTEGDTLSAIYVNMDSKVFHDFLGKDRTLSEDKIIQKQNIYANKMYMHALFMYTVAKSRGYSMKQLIEGDEKVKEVGDFISDLFQHYYSTFLLTFGGEGEMVGMGGD